VGHCICFCGRRGIGFVYTAGNGGMLVSKINRAEHVGWDNNSGGFKRVCLRIFSLAHRDAYTSVYSCALFAAFCETSKRLKNVWFFGGVLAKPAAEKGFAAADCQARWWRHPRHCATESPRVTFSTQKMAGSQKGFRRGWQAGTVQGMTLAIALATPVSHHD